MSYSIYSIFLSTASRGHIPDTATTNNNIKMKNKTEMKTEKKSAKKSAKKKWKIKSFKNFKNLIKKNKKLESHNRLKNLKFIVTPNVKIISNEMKSHQIKSME